MFLAPLITSAAGFLGFGAAAAALVGSVGASLGASLVGIGASLLVSALLPRRRSTTTVGGAEQDLKLGGDVERQVVFGTAAVAGHLVDVIAWGESNAIEAEVIALADWECDALVGLIVDGEEKTLVPQATIGAEDARFFVDDRDNGNFDTTDDAKHYGSKLEIRFYRGAPTQVADAELIAHSGGYWTEAHRGDGICYVVVKKTYDADLFSGFPTWSFILRGAKVWDPRLDSTVGGDGDQRRDDPTTWAWSQNPAICLLNWQLGFERAGSLFMGEGVPATDLPLDLYLACASICDEVVETSDGTEPRYAVSAIAVEGTEHRSILEAFVAAMAGGLYEQAGVFLPICGAARTIAATITDDDLLRDAQVRVTRKRSRAELLNHISGSYTSPADLWSSKGYTAVGSSTDEAADNGRLAGQIDLPQVTSQFQAERIAAIRYRENRCQTTASIVVGLHRIGIEVGDWIRWTSSRWGKRTYRVAGWRLALAGETIGLELSLAEIDAAVYADGAPSAGLPVAASPPSATLTRTVTGFSASPSTVTSSLGEVQPAALFAWSPPSDATVVAVIVEYRLVGATSAQTIRSDAPETGSAMVGGLVGGADYEARATIVTDPPRATAWTSWTGFETVAAVVAPASIDTSALVPSLSATVEALSTAVDDLGSALLAETLSRVSDRKRASAIGARVETTVREEYTAGQAALASRIDTVEAALADDIGVAIASETTARVSGDEALGTRIDTVDASIGAVTASIASETTARAATDAALASQIGALTAAVGATDASVASEAAARVTADEAIASDVTALGARMTAAEGGLSAQATATDALQVTVTGQGDDISALSASLTELQASGGAATADGSIKFVAAADQTGALARYELIAKTALEGGGDDATAAMTIEAVTDGTAAVSQVKFRADRFYIVSDTGEIVPFAVVDGVVYMDALQIRHVLNIGAGGSSGEILVWGT